MNTIVIENDHKEDLGQTQAAFDDFTKTKTKFETQKEQYFKLFSKVEGKNLLSISLQTKKALDESAEQVEFTRHKIEKLKDTLLRKASELENEVMHTIGVLKDYQDYITNKERWQWCLDRQTKTRELDIDERLKILARLKNCLHILHNDSVQSWKEEHREFVNYLVGEDNTIVIESEGQK